MSVKSLPTEFAVNMFLDKTMIIQQSDLPIVNSYNYFDENSPCHIYFICKRSRIAIIPELFRQTDQELEFSFSVQKGSKFEVYKISLPNEFKSTDLVIKSEFPFSIFTIELDSEVLLKAKAATFLTVLPRNLTKGDDYLDLEILYIGQSYGTDGGRTAPDRLVSHSTLQGIYSEALQNNPDSEIWLVLTSFNQINITMMDGRIKMTKEEANLDRKRMSSTLAKLSNGLNEQQTINFTEAALIRYFEPPYNKEYKNTFPNPAHKTYSECYDLDINSVCIELVTDESINVRFFSKSVKPSWCHMKDFLLHSPQDRRSMFDF